jgi:hypothetical protein
MDGVNRPDTKSKLPMGLPPLAVNSPKLKS